MARSLNAPGAWTISDHLLASAVELMQETNILLIRAHFKDPPSLDVQRIPRPGQEASEPKRQTIHDVRRALMGGDHG